jgi:hypothetical protein
MPRLFFPFLQIGRGRVESVGSALRLYRFLRLGFDLTVMLRLACPSNMHGYL